MSVGIASLVRDDSLPVYGPAQDAVAEAYRTWRSGWILEQARRARRVHEPSVQRDRVFAALHDDGERRPTRLAAVRRSELRAEVRVGDVDVAHLQQQITGTHAGQR